MTRRRSILTMSLLGMLAFCAFAAQNAFAWETALDTTAFECSTSAAAKDYADAHCDNTIVSGGSYGHKSIGFGAQVEIETSNTATKNSTTEAEEVVLGGELLGVPVKITCLKVEPHAAIVSFVENLNPGDFEGTVGVVFTECVLEGNGSSLGCHVEEPVTLLALFHGVEQGIAPAREMAIEFTPDPSTSTTLATLHFTGTGCLLTTANIKGRIRGTGSGADGTGATLHFQPADESLTFGGNPATLTGTFTTRVSSTGRALVTTTAQ
ncbi:MAG TPA: hypothetical protein VMH33_09335 [Solirubrobacterales bacterium]|nr:hypothetical protein [Solirubrobacterales bacterium]